MFTKVLVANRGEIAVRIIRTLKQMNISSVAVFSDVDGGSLHTLLADESVFIGPADARSSYLDIDRVIEAAKSVGAEGIHPGYGFLSENAAFADACAAAGIVFIGPSAGVITAMGDKIGAKDSVTAVGVRVVPGFHQAGADDAKLLGEIARIGFPVIIKPSAGGGGKGMRVIHSIDEAPAALASARREAAASFGDDTLLLERFIESARHVEVQIIGDEHGLVLHLGDRDCSLQRRHQKVVEEAPAPGLPDDVRLAMWDAAVRIAKSVNYTSVGTVEFVVDAMQPKDFFFLEMNTRLQVEHPVTELVTGLDLVELQIRVAAGEALPMTQEEVKLTGHAVEVRVYAEDSNRNFLPASGTLIRYQVPKNVRIDSGVLEGSVIGTNYDPLVFKVVTWATERPAAFKAMDVALSECCVLGVSNNIATLRTLVQDPAVRAGDVSTSLIEKLGLGQSSLQPDDEILIGAALRRQLEFLPDHEASAWDHLDGWRVGAPAPIRWRFAGDDRVTREVSVFGHGAKTLVSVDGGPVQEASIDLVRGSTYRLALNDRIRPMELVIDGERTWACDSGSSWELSQVTDRQLKDHDGSGASSDIVRSPMPGTVTLVGAAVGQFVTKGAVLVVVEAMKMEYALTAPHDGQVAAITSSVGDLVGKDQVLAEIAPAEEI